MQLHAIVSGRVQGVWFRGTTQEKAEELDLKGWVCNLADGRVEVLAVGPQEDLKKFLNWLYIGPSLAKVTQLDYEWSSSSPQFMDFRITY